MGERSVWTICSSSLAAISAMAACAHVPPAAPEKPTGSAAIAVPSLPPPMVQPAVDGILNMFETRPIVAMSDAHGLAQLQDFYGAIVRDPRFARAVGNVVVEFAGAGQQAVLDRYISGEAVPYAELRKVWTDAPGWTPTVTSLGFANFFAAVRAANLALPPNQRIRVFAGDPPVNWPKATASDVSAALNRRDSHAASVIIDNILSKNRKALVIYGGAHLASDAAPQAPTAAAAQPRSTPNPGAEQAIRKFLTDGAAGAFDFSTMVDAMADRVRPRIAAIQADLKVRGAITSMTFQKANDAGQDTFEVAYSGGSALIVTLTRDAAGKLVQYSGVVATSGSIRDIVERRYPNSFFVISSYTGHVQGDCSQRFEQKIRDWPVPALATLMRGSSLEADLAAPGCTFGEPGSTYMSVGGATPAERDSNAVRALVDFYAQRSGLSADGFLYLAPAADLVRGPTIPDIYLDADYRQEISRRQQLRGRAALPAVDMESVPVTSARWRTGAARGGPGEAERLAAFSVYDRSRDRRLDAAEHKALLEALGTPAGAEAQFIQRDSDKDGFLSTEEFKAPLAQ